MDVIVYAGPQSQRSLGSIFAGSRLSFAASLAAASLTLAPLRRRGVIIFLTVQGRTTHSIYPLDINSFSPYRDSCL